MSARDDRTIAATMRYYENGGDMSAKHDDNAGYPRDVYRDRRKIADRRERDRAEADRRASVRAADDLREAMRRAELFAGIPRPRLEPLDLPLQMAPPARYRPPMDPMAAAREFLTRGFSGRKVAVSYPTRAEAVRTFEAVKAEAERIAQAYGLTCPSARFPLDPHAMTRDDLVRRAYENETRR